MAKNRTEGDVTEVETVIPEPPAGTPTEVAKRAWQVAWSASNAAAGYHASIINHLVAHEKKVIGELAAMRVSLTQDFASFRSTIVASLGAVGIRINLSPSGEHAAVTLGEGGGSPRDRVASSHDLEAGLAEVGERIEEEMDERLRNIPGGIPSERIRAMLTEERAHIESEQRIMRLELEKSQLELSHANEVQRLKDKSTDLTETNNRWLRIAFMIAGGVITVLAGVLIWKMTEGRAKLPG